MSFKCPSQDRFDGNVNNKLGEKQVRFGKMGNSCRGDCENQTGSEDRQRLSDQKDM